MLTFTAPWWLLGLALLPAVRWLHRFGRHRRAVVVPRAALWSGAEDTGPSGRERQPPDPVWRRRALILALLCIALSEPRTRASGEALTIWVDDSLSMLTRETQGTRLDLGLQAARALLLQHDYAEVQVRRLGDPWRSLGAATSDVAATIAAQARLNGEVDAPPDALLQRNRSHWLVTDGANRAVTAWAARRAERVIRVGSVDRNVGLELLAARRNLQDPSKFDVQITIRNGGSAAEHRELVIRTGSEEVHSAHDLEPGATTAVQASVGATGRVQALLSPTDALPEDDAIELDATALRRHTIALDASCPPALQAAISAHPALRISDTRSVTGEAIIDCGSGGLSAGSGAPLLRLHPDRVSTPAAGVPVWSSAIPSWRHVAFDPRRVRISSHIEANAGDTVLLAVGQDPVIVRRAGATVIDVALDFAHPDVMRDPAMALIVDLLIEQLFGRDLLDIVVSTDRGYGSARVVPITDADLARADERATNAQQRYKVRSQPFVVIALLVLLWEIVALVLQWHRLRPRVATYAA